MRQHYLPAGYLGLFSDKPASPYRNSLVSIYRFDKTSGRHHIRKITGASNTAFLENAWGEEEERALNDIESNIPSSLLRVERAALSTYSADIFEPEEVELDPHDLSIVYSLYAVFSYRHPNYASSVDELVRAAYGKRGNRKEDGKRAAALRKQADKMLRQRTTTMLVVNEVPQPLNVNYPFFSLKSHHPGEIGTRLYHFIPVTPLVTAVVVENNGKQDPLSVIPANRALVLRQSYDSTFGIAEITANVDDSLEYVSPVSVAQRFGEKAKAVLSSRPDGYSVSMVGSRFFVSPGRHNSLVERADLSTLSLRDDFEYMRGRYQPLRSAHKSTTRVLNHPLWLSGSDFSCAHPE